ncbi:Protein spinster 3 [Aphanomyces cochlioides]|nr:Protein spinster 3 [Aphanomyces cochlioides]
MLCGSCLWDLLLRLQHCVSLIALPSRGWFLTWTAVVIVVSGTISPAMLTALFHGVKPSRRGLMTGINSVLVNLLGDVPAPIVIGWIKDREPPHCDSVVIDGIVRLNPASRDDKDGLMMAMSTPMFGFAFTIIVLRLRFIFHGVERRSSSR